MNKATQAETIQATNFASAMNERRVTETVAYPVTGDFERDIITGVRQVLYSKPNPNPRMVVRVLRYLLSCAEDDLDRQKDIEKMCARAPLSRTDQDPPEYPPQQYYTRHP
jgi:hypothetical protein